MIPPEPPEAAQPDPDDAPLRPLMGPVFWIMVTLCVVCVAAGIGVAWLGPRIWAPEAPPRDAGVALPRS
ncbi:MAG: hypothetical protein JNK30_06625 [Phenylobacterium sp.]|uniref:hypothetical protein n=1 Tax=Phenylobacterium sp. TaxID=1871053 RepID=UPI001A5B90A7|nr:hypothetical protein [Phenylobacterium sp.]MBL8771042.1 hypothetical protein [Phenylobacterium sp.]